MFTQNITRVVLPYKKCNATHVEVMVHCSLCNAIIVCLFQSFAWSVLEVLTAYSLTPNMQLFLIMWTPWWWNVLHKIHSSLDACSCSYKLWSMSGSLNCCLFLVVPINGCWINQMKAWQSARGQHPWYESVELVFPKVLVCLLVCLPSYCYRWRTNLALASPNCWRQVNGPWAQFLHLWFAEGDHKCVEDWQYGTSQKLYMVMTATSMPGRPYDITHWREPVNDWQLSIPLSSKRSEASSLGWSLATKCTVHFVDGFFPKNLL